MTAGANVAMADSLAIAAPTATSLSASLAPPEIARRLPLSATAIDAVFSRYDSKKAVLVQRI